MQVLKAIGTVVVTIAITLAVVQWLPVKGEGNETDDKAVSQELSDGIQIDGKRLEQQGYYVESYSFDLNMDRFGKVKLVPVSLVKGNPDQLSFILVDEEQNIVYELPTFIGESYGTYDHLIAVYMRDVNGDGLKDVIVIAQYTAENGKGWIEGRSVAGVYFQTEDGFASVDSIDKELNEKGITNNIAEVLGYLKRMQIEN